MRTYLDCIPCFMRQVLQTGSFCGLQDEETKKLLDAVGAHIRDVDLEESPPEMARKLQRVLVRQLGESDPYARVKEESNQAALGYAQTVRNMIRDSDDRLLSAVQLAIAGNIIDYGAVENLQVDRELTAIMDREREKIAGEDHRLFALDRFRGDLSRARTLLYLGDNAGEIVFDRVLIETLLELYPHLEITFATRGAPILNDVLLHDAQAVGLDQVVPVISSGSDAPGTVLDRCSESFLELFERADLVISKGQGNFESLSDSQRPIYYLLIAKCEVICRELGCNLRDIILMRR